VSFDEYWAGRVAMGLGEPNERLAAKEAWDAALCAAQALCAKEEDVPERIGQLHTWKTEIFYS